MLKKLFVAFIGLIVAVSFAVAAVVDVNKADQAGLDGIKGIGPSLSKAILAERAKGEFKDWADLQSRVKGIGEKNSVKFSAEGLVVNGQPKTGVAPKESANPKAAAAAKASADSTTKK